MSGYLAYYQDLSRADRLSEIESLMRMALDELRLHPAVAGCSDGIPLEDLTLVHFTFDEPLAYSGGLLLQFTYHLGRSAPFRDVVDEVRGSGLAWIDDAAGVRLDDVEAERYQLVADVQLAAQPHGD
jgi:hypothetical protein